MVVARKDLLSLKTNLEIEICPPMLAIDDYVEHW